jgi:hypothetical protein
VRELRREMDRVGEIRKRAADCHTYTVSEDEVFERYPEDVSYLLEHIEELEQAVELVSSGGSQWDRLKAQRDYWRTRAWFHAEKRAERDKLEAENTRLREQLERRDEHLAEVRRGGKWGVGL